MEGITLGNKTIDAGSPPYFIAEIGSNHNGEMRLAKSLIDSAVDAGADAVKFQSWTESSLISRSEYLKNTKYEDPHRHFGSLKEMVQRYQLTPGQHRELSAYCKTKNIDFISTPFSESEVDLLMELDVPYFKVASMDVNNLRLLSYIGTKNLPVILSTGMSSLGEIERAISILRSGGSDSIGLLHCISIYPPKHEDLNLRNIPMLRRAFGVPVGYSDHSIGVTIPCAAIALGACVIEKHFTLDKSLAGWDHAISADPAEMKQLVKDGGDVFQALGSAVRHLNTAELEKRKAFRRCCVVNRELPAGHVLQDSDLEFKRPGNGIHPDEAKYIIGRSLKRALNADEIVTWADFI